MRGREGRRGVGQRSDTGSPGLGRGSESKAWGGRTEGSFGQDERPQGKESRTEDRELRQGWGKRKTGDLEEGVRGQGGWGHGWGDRRQGLGQGTGWSDMGEEEWRREQKTGQDRGTGAAGWES